MYYAYELFQRANRLNSSLWGGRLFEQYVVDQFCKVEFERLHYLRRNHVSLRAVDYTSLCEQLEDLGNTENVVDAVRAGCLFVLLSKYVGGD